VQIEIDGHEYSDAASLNLDPDGENDEDADADANFEHLEPAKMAAIAEEDEEEKGVQNELMTKSNVDLGAIIDSSQDARLQTRNEESTFKKHKTSPKQSIRNPQSMTSESSDQKSKNKITANSEGISDQLFQHMMFSNIVKPQRKSAAGAQILYEGKSEPNERQTLKAPIGRADSEVITQAKLGSMPNQTMMKDSIMHSEMQMGDEDDGEFPMRQEPETSEYINLNAVALEKETIWIPKAIGFISVNPFYDFLGMILVDLYYTIFWDISEKTEESMGAIALQQQKQNFLIEQHIKQVVDGMCPLYEGIQIQYNLKSELLKHILGPDVELTIPAINRLPFSNTRFFERTFQLLKIEEVIAVYTAILSEEKTILIVAAHKFDLLAIF